MLTNELDVKNEEEMKTLSDKLFGECLSKNNCHNFFSKIEKLSDLIHTPKINEYVSIVAQHPSVRKSLIPVQQIKKKNGSIVMEGRDIGTVVMPSADIKFFLVADQETRVNRRLEELIRKGYNITFQEVEKEIINRDLIDSKRKDAPLTKPEGAIIIDTSNKNVSQVVEEMLIIIRSIKV